MTQKTMKMSETIAAAKIEVRALPPHLDISELIYFYLQIDKIFLDQIFRAGDRPQEAAGRGARAHHHRRACLDLPRGKAAAPYGLASLQTRT